MKKILPLLFWFCAVSAQAQLSPSKMVSTDASNHLTAYAGTSPAACSNQFLRRWTLSDAGVGAATCATVSLTADVTGILPLANGGTAVNNASAGSGTFLRGDGTGFAVSTLTLPNTLAVKQVLYASSANVAGGSNAFTFDGTNLGLGTASPVAPVGVSKDGATPTSALFNSDDVIVMSNSGNNAQMRVIASTATANQGAHYVLIRSRGTPSAPTGVSSGDLIGTHFWQGLGTDGSRATVATASVEVDAATGVGIVPGRLIYSTADSSGTNTEAMRIDSAQRVGIGVTPTARLHLKAGTTAASSAPLKFTSGSLQTTAEAGAVEFLTDKYYGTITTAAARKEITLNDSALTSGSLVEATTNGRLQNATTTGTGNAVRANSPTLTDTITINNTGGSTILRLDATVNTGVARVDFRDETGTVMYTACYRDSDQTLHLTAGTTCTANTGLLLDTSGNSFLQRTNVNTLEVTASSTPVATDACTQGKISWDTNFVYVCTASGAWKRAALSTY